ncbi:hypothetical protein [Leifsonia xyli]|uniref:hypothetical protein n=1 Tax=Leifsonia xyli TaxID=1575 RepID=UPI003D66FF63
MKYQEIDDALAHVYLEDSFVLSISVTPGRAVFGMEFVVLPGHERYVEPASPNPYHYERGELVFSSVKSLVWSGQGVPPSIDPVDGSEDFGNIDSLVAENSSYLLEGDWGEMQISSQLPPKVMFADTRS